MKPTEELLKQIVLNSVDPEGKKYWIKSLKRDRPDALAGVEVEIASFDDQSASTIYFDKYDLSVDGPLKEQDKKIRERFYQVLSDENPKFAKNLEIARRFIANAQQKLTQNVLARMVQALEKGEIVSEEALKIAAGDVVMAKWKGVKLVGHEKIILPEFNPYNTSDRKIEIGEIYVANLDPVYPKEIGGVRPVLVVEVLEKNLVSAVPLSTKVDKYSQFFKNSVILKFKDYPDLNYLHLNQENIIACIHAKKPLNIERLQMKVTTISEDDMEKVKKAITNNIFTVNRNTIENKSLENINFSQTPSFQAVNTTDGKKVNSEKIIASSQNVTSKTLMKDATLENFPLTDDQVREIVQGKFDSAIKNNSQLIFYPPKDVLFDKDEDGTPVIIAKGRCAAFRRQFEYIFTLDAFTASTTIGSDHQYDDDVQLRSPLAQKLVSLYGEDYKQAYARHWVKVFSIEKGQYLTEGKCKKFNEHLADVGLQCPNPKEVLRKGLNGYDYYDLTNLDTEAE